MERKNKFCSGWFFHKGELEQPICKVSAKAGTCGGASNLTEEEGFVYRLHPYMAAKMRVDNGNHLYNVARHLEGDWKPVVLPHDWTAGEEHLSPDGWADQTRAVESGYLPGGIGYYRKRFRVPSESLGKRMIVEFEGIMRDAVVWVNGCYVGSHLSGYTGFVVDVSEYLFYGEEGENVILVRASTEVNEGWWAEGAGIYRPVWLYELEPVHVKRYGIFVYTENISAVNADVQTETTVENAGTEEVRCIVRQQIISEEGTMIAQEEASAQIGGLGTAECKITLSVANPRLWDLDAPILYILRTQIEMEGRVIDETDTAFGIRDVKYTADGLCLNGKTIEIRGVCVHQDFAGVGTALTEDLITYRLEKIKEMGGNSYRSAHHPASEGLLAACDHMGILVLNENRRFELSKDSLEDLEELVLGSRNHACVFMWSLENEELMSTLPNGKRLLAALVSRVHKLDPTRQCTVAGHFACRDEEYVKIPDVAGFNYDMDDAAAMRDAVAGLNTMASEDGSFVSTRGIYADDEGKGYCDSYDSGSYMVKLMARQMGLEELPTGTLGGASSPNDLAYSWNHYKKKAPFLGGMFIWTAFDYRGETFPWNWPAVLSGYGAMDFCGFEKDAFYYWKNLWDEKPGIHLLPHWNWTAGEMVQVDIYANCEEVELLLNGESLGRRKHEKGAVSTWQVVYQPGEIEAVGFQDGKIAARESRQTAGEPADIRLEKIYGGGKEVLYKAMAVDEEGIVCPTACLPLQFAVENGIIAGLGNGNPACHDPYRDGYCETFNGLALAIVRRAHMDLEPILKVELI